VCAAANTEVFLVRRGVPVHQNVLFDTPQAARAIARGVYEATRLPFKNAQPAWRDRFRR